MRIILTGVPGSGKSTICEKLTNEIPNINIINYGDLIVNVAINMLPNKIKVREDVRKIPRPIYKEIQTKAANKLSKIKGEYILDTHMSLKTPSGYYPGLIPETLKIIDPDVIILLEFNPKDVVERRDLDRKSGKRASRDLEKEEEIIIHQSINRIFAVSNSALAQSYVKIIDLTWKQEYEFQHTDYAVSEIKKILNY